MNPATLIKDCFIFSAQRSNLPASVNEARHAILKEQLRAAGHAFLECAGRYENVLEDSVLVMDYAVAKAFAQEYEQDCIAVFKNGKLHLDFMNGDLGVPLVATLSIGKPVNCSAYTMIFGLGYLHTEGN